MSRYMHFTKQNFIAGALVAAAFLGVGVVKVSAASFSFDPASATMIQGCTQSVNIDVDATGENSNASDVEISYDPAQIQIIDSNPDIPGIQVKNGTAYESYFVNQVDPSTGKILIATGSFIGSLTTKKVYATIQFTATGAANTSGFTFRFDGVGATLDSNIADTTTSNDLLTSVVNGSYTFVAGSCVSDTQAPQVQFIVPTPYQSNVALNSNVVIRITDNLSGIDTNSLKFIINGVTYTAASPEVSSSGSALDYTFTINPNEDFPANKESTITVSGQDVSGNTFSSQTIFNIPPEQVAAAAGGSAIACSVPTKAATDFATATNNVTIFKGTPLQDTIIDKAVNSLGANTVINIVATTGFSLGFLQALTVLNTPGLIYNFLAFLLGKNRGKTWGIVIDAVTGKPIPFAACRLYLEGTLNVHQQTVSDPEGRYGFAIEPGAYRLEVSQSNYDKFTRSIVIEKGEQSYVYDVKLYPVGYAKNKAHIERTPWDKIKDIYFQVRPYIFIAGLALAIFSVAVSQTLINVVIAALYVMILGATVASRLSLKAKYAAVVDSSNNLRIPFALVKIFNTKTWELVDSQVTNTNGQFDFWGEPGEYGLLVSVRGYTFPSKKQTNYPVIDEKYSAMLRVNLAKGQNRIQIYVDPAEYATPKPGITSSTKSPASGPDSLPPVPAPPVSVDPANANLATPFG